MREDTSSVTRFTTFSEYVYCKRSEFVTCKMITFVYTRNRLMLCLSRVISDVMFTFPDTFLYAFFPNETPL